MTDADMDNGWAAGRRSVLAGIGAGAASLALPGTLAARRADTSPEALGIPSSAIGDLLAAFAGSPHELHSLIVQRHGRVAAQGWWSPYRADVPQLMYSLSKSFTSTAIGFAVSEGRMRLEDRLVDVFPDRLPASGGANLSALTVRHLLTMTVGHATDSTPAMTRERDWVRAFLAQPVAHPPGSVFLYDSGATYMLSAMLQKACGQRLADYLRPRLFDPLGIRDWRWATCPLGVTTGGWGLKVPTGALAALGQLYLQGGRWRDRRLLPAAWVADATRAHILQPITGAPAGTDPAAFRAASDWHQGYGYQFWRCRHDAFRGDGAFGQYCVVLPRQQAVVAITSRTADMQGLLDLVWQHLLPHLGDAPLRPDRAAAQRLRGDLAALILPLPAGIADTPGMAPIDGRRFVLESNAMGARAVTLRRARDGWAFELDTGARRSTVVAGSGRWVEGETDMPGTPPEFTELIGTFTGPPAPVRVAAAAAWRDPATLEMIWRYTETPHHDTVTCRFDGDTLRVTFRNSITRMASVHAEPRPELVGRAA